MKIAVVLSGCGVYDGTEIHEAVATLYSIDSLGHEYVIFAPDKPQHHTVNHLTGEEEPVNRNVLAEAARIARGNIQPLSSFSADEVDAMVIPGGFGAAKNLSTWAFDGPAAQVDPDLSKAVKAMVKKHKPIAALCIAPVTLSKIFEGMGSEPELTVGTTAEASPYDIKEIHEAMSSIGAKTVEKTIREVQVDQKNKIVTAPCYMMEARISEIFNNAAAAVKALTEL